MKIFSLYMYIYTFIIYITSRSFEQRTSVLFAFLELRIAVASVFDILAAISPRKIVTKRACGNTDFRPACQAVSIWEIQKGNKLYILTCATQYITYFFIVFFKNLLDIIYNFFAFQKLLYVILLAQDFSVKRDKVLKIKLKRTYVTSERSLK